MKSKKVFWFSILGLGFLVLTFLINWLFIIGAVAVVIINQRELIKNNKNKFKNKN